MALGILELTKVIESNTVFYHDYLVSKGIPLPTHQPLDLRVEQPYSLPDDVAKALNAAIEATDELHDLLSGPTGLIMNAAPQTNKMLSLQFIQYNDIARIFAPGEQTTFKRIAEKCKLNEDDTRRMLRLAMTDHLFQEPKNGVVAHTAATQTLAANPLLGAWIGMTARENWPAMTRAVEALEKWPGSEEPLESGYALAHNMKENPFTAWERDPPRAKQFADAMSFLHSDAGFRPDYLFDGFDFDTIGRGVFVDVGGSHGQVSTAVATRYPKLRCIVQDMPATIAEGKAQMREELAERVTFMAHDFWEEQPVKGADVYYFRWIFHDWSDTYSVKILRNLIPALKKGSKVLINDICIPPPGVLSLQQERWMRGIDVIMKAFTNAKEREAEDWAGLFAKADPRFYFRGVRMPPGSKCAVIEAEWQPEDASI